MKTLDDALSAPGVIPDDEYGLSDNNPKGVSAFIGSQSGIHVRLDGCYHPFDLRRIADHLDPQADNVAAIRAEARRAALEEAARLVDGLADSDSIATDARIYETASAIRALIGKEPTP